MMEPTPGWSRSHAEHLDECLVANLHNVVTALARSPSGPMLDALGMALWRLSSQCMAHADSVAAAAGAGVPGMEQRAQRARQLAAVAGQVWEMVRAHALGPDAAVLGDAQRRALEAASRGAFPG